MSQTEDRSAFDWEARFQNDDTPWERPGLHPAAEAWLARGVLARGQSVVIPGCGRCAEVAAFARAGLKVTAADLSDTAIAWQKAKIRDEQLSCEYFEGDILRSDDQRWCPDVPVDRVYDQTFLCAIHPRLREQYAYALANLWLKSGGQLLALFMQKDERGGPPFGCSLDAMRDLFSDTDWIWPDPNEFQAWPHPNLNGKPELAAVLTRR
ncbi:methyltransferase domain-containing protein [uncultured Maricaulis sp.]|uniref:methyltransferase domain-containing protein n=1 Tax=uncultured Maricaulis sp. TaxID=174710 RepID=UPI002636ACFE|nr:methyltransferase domain-containing protein [uncultured Maricaulis sp.]